MYEWGRIADIERYSKRRYIHREEREGEREGKRDMKRGERQGESEIGVEREMKIRVYMNRIGNRDI